MAKAQVKFRFYPKDWFADARCMSPAAKGMSFDFVCYLADTKPRWRAELPIDALARICGDPMSFPAVFQEVRDRCPFLRVTELPSSDDMFCLEFIGFQTYRARRAAASLYTARTDVRARIFKRDGDRCRTCGSTENLTIDHKKPVVLRGSNSDDNLQTLCRRCNSAKGASLL